MKTNRVVHTAFFLLATFAGAALAQVASKPASNVSFAGLPVSFAVPQGWKLAQQEGDLAALAPDMANPDAVAVVRPGVYRNADEFFNLAGQSLRDDLHIAGAEVAQAPRSYTLGGMNASSALLSAAGADGRRVAISLDVVMAASGVGLGVVTLAPAAQAKQIQATAEALLRTAHLGALSFNRQAAAALIGDWYKAVAATGGNSSGSNGGWASGANAYFSFREDGTYGYSSESFASVDVPGTGALSSSRTEDGGRYYPANGQLILISTRNGSSSLVFRVVDGKYIQLGNGYFARR